jgi:hypothetical protein
LLLPLRLLLLLSARGSFHPSKIVALVAMKDLIGGVSAQAGELRVKTRYHGANAIRLRGGIFTNDKLAICLLKKSCSLDLIATWNVAPSRRMPGGSG